MIFRTSAAAPCCSSASSRSRVSRPTIVSWPAETLGRRTFFGAGRRFTVLRVRVLAGCPPALERRLITFPKPQGKASYRLKIAYWKVDGCGFRHTPLSVRPMSALGQKRTSRHFQSMSALPPKADIGTQSRNVRFVPKADIPVLFDHLVGQLQKGFAH